MSDLLIENQRELLIGQLQLVIDPVKPVPRADHLRAAIADQAPELDLLHQHSPEGVIYRSPRVIYRVSQQTPSVLAIEEGVQALMSVQLVGRSLRMGNTLRRVLDTTLSIRQHVLGAAEREHRYRFQSPWLALNQENHQRFIESSIQDQQQFLSRQIVNNCLSLAKSYVIRITLPLCAEVAVQPVKVFQKGVPFIGFVGEFRVNFCIPDGMGLGKSVSKGFGEVLLLE